MPLNPEHCGQEARKRGDRWGCSLCGAWKWVIPRDEQNRWRASSCLPNADIRRDVLKILPKGLKLYTKQLAVLLARNEQATLELLRAMEKDGLLVHSFLSVDREHTIKRRVCLWESTGKPLTEEMTAVERRVPEAPRAPVFSCDALVMAMGRKA